MLGTYSNLEDVVRAYDDVLKTLDNRAKNSDSGRAYGGVLRASKGELVESIAKSIVTVAWKGIGGNPGDLNMDGHQIKLPFNTKNLHNIKDESTRQHVTSHINDYYYSFKPDVLVEIRGKRVLSIECKTYTENSMYKRILVDAALMRTKYPEMKFILLQLESQLGGDYSNLNGNTIGSTSTRTLTSYFDVDIDIITLLEGERDVNKPIHKHYKPLKLERLEFAANRVKDILRIYV